METVATEVLSVREETPTVRSVRLGRPPDFAFQAIQAARLILQPAALAHRYPVRDRNRVYGLAFKKCLACMGIEEVLTAPRSPWQNPYAERVIGTIRRECLDHVIVLSERHLRRVLGDCLAHYHRWRCHHSLQMDCPAPRPVQKPERGGVVEIEEAGGLYRHYERRAA